MTTSNINPALPQRTDHSDFINQVIVNTCLPEVLSDYVSNRYHFAEPLTESDSELKQKIKTLTDMIMDKIAKLRQMDKQRKNLSEPQESVKSILEFYHAIDQLLKEAETKTKVVVEAETTPWKTKKRMRNVVLYYQALEIGVTATCKQIEILINTSEEQSILNQGYLKMKDDGPNPSSQKQQVLAVGHRLKKESGAAAGGVGLEKRAGKQKNLLNAVKWLGLAAAVVGVIILSLVAGGIPLLGLGVAGGVAMGTVGAAAGIATFIGAGQVLRGRKNERYVTGNNQQQLLPQALQMEQSIQKSEYDAEKPNEHLVAVQVIKERASQLTHTALTGEILEPREAIINKPDQALTTPK